jgi:hypothetical protein
MSEGFISSKTVGHPALTFGQMPKYHHELKPIVPKSYPPKLNLNNIRTYLHESG